MSKNTTNRASIFSCFSSKIYSIIFQDFALKILFFLLIDHLLDFLICWLIIIFVILFPLLILLKLLSLHLEFCFIFVLNINSQFFLPFYL
jgi:hypothetical protein